MNRRGFLSLLGLTAGALALDPERLLWRPTKTIFVPKPRQPTAPRDVFVGIVAHNISAGNYGYVQTFGPYVPTSAPSREFIAELPFPESTTYQTPHGSRYRLMMVHGDMRAGDPIFL